MNNSLWNDEVTRALSLVVARAQRESNHAEEGKVVLIVEPQNVSISTDAVEYLKLCH